MYISSSTGAVVMTSFVKGSPSFYLYDSQKKYFSILCAYYNTLIAGEQWKLFKAGDIGYAISLSHT